MIKRIFFVLFLLLIGTHAGAVIINDTAQNKMEVNADGSINVVATAPITIATGTVDIGTGTINIGNAVNFASQSINIANDVSISAAALPLPAGASTESTLNDIFSEITALKDTDGIKKITDELPAGTQTIGKVKLTDGTLDLDIFTENTAMGGAREGLLVGGRSDGGTYRPSHFMQPNMDAEGNINSYMQRIVSILTAFNGTTFDRLRSVDTGTLKVAPYSATGDPFVLDFHSEVSAGNITNISNIQKFGQGTLSTTEVPVWDVATAYPWQTSAQSLEAVSSGNDTSAGTGARTIQVLGLDSNWDFQEETVTMNAGTQALANTYIRVFRAYVVTVGSIGTNENNIDIQVAGGGAIQARISADKGQTLMAIYTIPNGNTGYVDRWYSSVGKNDDAEIILWMRPFGGAFRVLNHQDIYQNSFIHKFDAKTQLPAKTDIYVTGKAGTGSIHISSGFDITLRQ